MADDQIPLPPPLVASAPPLVASAPPLVASVGATSPDDSLTRPAARPHRPGELTPAWRLALIGTWVMVFVAYMAVWKASEEIGIAAWWLGPRSNPQPIVVRILPFVVAAAFGVLSSYPVRRLPWINLGGAGLLALIAVPDLSRSPGLAMIEFVIAGAVALVSLASLTGRYSAGTCQAAPGVDDAER